MAKPKEKPGVILYWPMFDKLERLSKPHPDFRLSRALSAVRNYAQYGEVPDFSDDDLLDMFWVDAKEAIDADSERYENEREKNRIKGLRSDFKRNYAPAHNVSPDDEAEFQKYIESRNAVNRCQQVSTAVDRAQPIQPNTDTNTNTNPYSDTDTNTDTNPNPNSNSHYKGKKGEKVVKGNTETTTTGVATTPLRLSFFEHPTVTGMNDLEAEVERRKKDAAH